MAQRPVGIENMAVSSDISASQHSMKDNGNEENDVRSTQNNPKVDAPKKKTTFKITSVTKSSLRGGSGDLTQDNDLDSQDDLDDTVDSHTEDLSSEIYDTNSKTTDVDTQDPLLTPEEVLIKEKPARFKVVKVETKEPFKRGRWICYDYLDDKTETKQEEIHVNSGNSSAANSVHYVHGVDDPSKNPLIAGATGTMTSQAQPSTVPEGTGTAQGEIFQPIQPAPSSQPSVTPVSLTNASVAQSSSSVPYYVAQSGQPAAQSMPQMPTSSNSSLRIMNSASNLPHAQQSQTQASQSGPSGQPHPHPSQQVPVIPANVHSQPASLAGSVVSQQTPPGAMQTGEYVNSSGTGQVSVGQVQPVSSSQPQQKLPAGYVTGVSSASGMAGNIPMPQQNHLPRNTSSKAPDGYDENDMYPSRTGHANTNSSVRSADQGETTMSTLELAVGGITSTPAEDDITEEAFLEYFSSLSTYGGSGLFPPIMDESGESAHCCTRQNVNEEEARISSPLTVRCDSPFLQSEQSCSPPSQYSLSHYSCSPPSQYSFPHQSFSPPSHCSLPRRSSPPPHLMASSPPSSFYPLSPQLSFHQAAVPSQLNLSQPSSPNLRRRAMLSRSMLSPLASSASPSALLHHPSPLASPSTHVGSQSLSPLSAFPQYLSASWDNLASIPPHELPSPTSTVSSHHSSSPEGWHCASEFSAVGSPPEVFLSPLSAMPPHLSASMEALNLHPPSLPSPFQPYLHSSVSDLHRHLSSSMEALNCLHKPTPSLGASSPKLLAPTSLAAFPSHLSASMGALHLPHHQHHHSSSFLVGCGSKASPFQLPHPSTSVSGTAMSASLSSSVSPGVAAVASTPHSAFPTSTVSTKKKPLSPLSAPPHSFSCASTPFHDASSSREAYSYQMTSPSSEWLNQVQSPVDYPKQAASPLAYSQKVGTPPDCLGQMLAPVNKPVPSSLACSPASPAYVPSPLVYLPPTPSPLLESSPMSHVLYSPQVPPAYSVEVTSPVTFRSQTPSKMSGRSSRVPSSLAFSHEVSSPIASPKMPSPFAYSSAVPSPKTVTSPQVPFPLAYSTQMPSPLTGLPQIPSPLIYSSPSLCSQEPPAPLQYLPEACSPIVCPSPEPSRQFPSYSIPQGDPLCTPSPLPPQSSHPQLVMPASYTPSPQPTAFQDPSYPHRWQQPDPPPLLQQQLKFRGGVPPEILHLSTAASRDHSFPHRISKPPAVLHQQPRFHDRIPQVDPSLSPPSASSAQSALPPMVPAEESPWSSAARDTEQKDEGPREAESPCLPQTSQTKKPPLDCRRPSLRTQVRNHIGSMDSGSSTVAIDNKIEQAMDLVKSHLMYAVREEVEVLKAQIKELMERMRTVEYENKVLRGDATPETLAKLPAPLPPLQNPFLQQFMTTQAAPSSSSS